MNMQTLPQFDNLPFETIGLQALYQVFLSEPDGEFVDESKLIVHHQNLWDYESRVDWDLFHAVMDEPTSNRGAAVEGKYKPPTMQPGTRGEHWGVTVPEDCEFCYFQDLGAGYAKPLVRGPPGYPFATDAYLVDVRREGAPFTWYFQVAWKLVEAGASAKPQVQVLSEHQLWNPTNMQAAVIGDDQSLFYIESNEEYFLYYTGRFPTAGRIYPSGSYLHTHAEHEESFLFGAAPEVLAAHSSHPSLPAVGQSRPALPCCFLCCRPLPLAFCSEIWPMAPRQRHSIFHS